jgi:predicted phage terminase large subunit-like protein
MREKVWSMWRSVVKPRMRQNGSIVLSIATRWHEDDLSGRLLKDREDDWRTIVFPAIAEPGDALGRDVGEPMLSVQTHETREEALARWAKTKRSVGTAVFNALYQQHPGDVDGTVFKLAWWQYHSPADLPEADQIITSWDLTFGTGGEESGDWCVGTAWQRTGNRYFLLDMIRFRGPFTVQLERMTSFIGRFPNATAHLVEEAANGAAAISTLRRTLDGIVAVPVRAANGSKVVRAQSVAPLVEAHQVSLPEGLGFVDDFVTELSSFPTGEHDDIVDSTSQALTRMRESDVGPIEVWTERPRLGGW